MFPASNIAEHALLDVSVTALLLALWPLFALIVAGYFLRLRAFPSAPSDRQTTLLSNHSPCVS